LSFLISGLIYLCISFLLYIGVVEYKLIYLLQENLLTNKTVTPQIHNFIKHRLGDSLLQFLQAINFYNRWLNKVLSFIENGLFVGFIANNPQGFCGPYPFEHRNEMVFYGGGWNSSIKGINQILKFIKLFLLHLFILLVYL